jgi:signal transduction histidine kinase
METPSESPGEAIKRLQRCINDLAGILVLPAMWSGSEPSQIVDTLLEVLLDMLGLDLAYMRLEAPNGERPVEMVRFAQPQSRVISAEEIGTLLNQNLPEDPRKWPSSTRSRIGDNDLSIAPRRLGLQGEIGVVFAGSQRLDFPGQTEKLLLDVAANQAVITLQEAQLLSEQRRIADELDRRVAERTSQLAAANQELKKRIAEGKLAEEKLRRNKAYLAEAQKLSHTGSFGWKVSTGEIIWSEETFRIFECDPMTKPTLEYILKRVHPDDIPFVNELIERACQDGKNWELEHRMLTSGGAVKHVRVVAHAERTETGELEFVGAVMDVTTAKKTEADLRTSAKITQSLVAVRADVSAALAKPIPAREMLQECALAMVRHLDAAFARIWTLNHAEGELELQASAGCYTRLDGTHSRIKMGNLKVGLIALEQKAYLTNDVLSDARVGDKEWARSGGFVSFAGYPLVVDGRTVGVMGMFAHHALSDAVTEALASVADAIAQGLQRRRSEEALRKAQANLAHVARLTTMGELTASIAHEVNQPLAAVVTNANACLRWLGHAPPNLWEVHAAIERIIRDGNRGSDVIARIRGLVKNEQVTRTALDINEIIRETTALLQWDIPGMALRTELTDGLPQVNADRVQLQQVLLNLTMNAMDAMRPVQHRPHELGIWTRTYEGSAVLVAVQDTGIGLDQERMEKFFETFYTTKPNGLGMGLSICRSIIEGYGGRLWAERNEDFGATFLFTLPGDGGGAA